MSALGLVVIDTMKAGTQWPIEASFKKKEIIVKKTGRRTVRLYEPSEQFVWEEVQYWKQPAT